MTKLLDTDPHEIEILKHHIQKGHNGYFELKNIREAMRRYGYSYQQLKDILAKIDAYAFIYELEVAAGFIA